MRRYEMTKDTIYVDKISGHYEAWTYSDGRKVRFNFTTLSEIEKYAEKYDYELVFAIQ
jgi:hypothetical protein